MTLSHLSAKQQAKITDLPNDLVLATKLAEQGIVPDLVVTLAHKAPFKGPVAINFDGIKMSLKREVTDQIKVEIVK